MSDTSNLPPTVPPPKKNHAWIYFFVFVFVASVGVAWFMIQYNLSIQLTPAQLEEAKQRWKENGPKSYDMFYKTKINHGDYTKFAVKVRNGNVIEALANGRPLDVVEGHDPSIYQSMDRHFHDIERFMDLDNKPGAKKVYVVAQFDADLGYLRYYVRNVMGVSPSQRIEIMVEKLVRVD